MPSTSTAKSHDYQYSYDPSNQSYTLVGQNSPSSGLSGLFSTIGGGSGPISKLIAQLQSQGKFGPAPQYSYNPSSQSYTQLASGGSVAAQQAQSMGRGQDTMLVHMTPNEVKGLQALAMSHGGSLTINPHTGLPEAGFLSALLPAIAGFALGPAGFALMSAPMAGLTVGALTGLATGSLGKGLMAGLGAYGGAGIGAGLAGAGATTAGGMAAQETAKQAAGQALAEQAAKQAALEGIPLTADYAQLAASTATPAQIAAQQGIQGNLAMAGRGFEGLTTEAGRKAFMGAAPTGTLPTAGLALSSALAPEPPKAGAKPQAYIRPYEFAWNPNEQAYSPSPTPGDTSERRYFVPTFTPMPIEKAPSNTISAGYTTLPTKRAAGGGIMDLAAGGSPYTESPKETSANDELGRDEYAKGGKIQTRSLEGDDLYTFAANRKDSSMKASVAQNFAAGGLGAAKQALPPRFLSGGGDGMSDSIKANIDGKQEARLSDSEFVVPADVVSHLGNGSSKAGAKKLYAMMDRIRKARTGKARQAPAVKAEKYMPA